MAFHDKLSFVLFTGSSTQCPPSHKWAFLNGRYCCKYNEEKVNVTEGSRCDGGEMSLTSSCCKDDAYTKCTRANGGCVNSGNVIIYTFTLDFNNLGVLFYFYWNLIL